MPPLIGFEGQLQQIRESQAPQPGSQRCEQQPTSFASDMAPVQQRCGSGRRLPEDNDSSGSLKQDIQQLSEYGGGTLGKRQSANDLQDDGQDDSQDPDGGRDSSNKLKKNNRMNCKDYQEDNDFNLSDLDEEQRKELVELEMQIEKDSLTRGERRRLQNKRNVLKAKIKKELETEGHKSTISKLQKRLFQLKKMVNQTSHYKEQRDALREENKILKKQLREVNDRIKKTKEQRRVYQTQILQQGNIVNQPNSFNTFDRQECDQ